MAMKPRSMKKKPMAMKRGGKAKKMMRGGMAKKPMAMTVSYTHLTLPTICSV